MYRVVSCFVLILLLFGVVACRHERTGAPSVEALPAISDVQIVTVHAQTVTDTLDAVGTVRSTQRSTMAAKMIAQVVAVSVREGERVKTGQVLAQLDARDVHAQRQKARASLQESHDALEEVTNALLAARKTVEAASAQRDVAEATLHRYQTLLEQRSVAPQEYDEVFARSKVAAAEIDRAQAGEAALAAKKRQVREKVAQTEAELTNAETAVSYATIVAPIDGIVVEKPVSLGNMVTPGVPLLTIEEERYRLEAATEESLLGQLQVGQQVSAIIDALARRVTGAIVEIVPTSDPVSRTVMVKIDLPPLPGLHSGMYGKAEFPVGAHSAVVVPQAAMVERGQLHGVFVLNDTDVVMLRLVKTGKVRTEGVEVLSGLQDGERVAVGQVDRLVEGRKVKAAEALAQAGEAR